MLQRRMTGDTMNQDDGLLLMSVLVGQRMCLMRTKPVDARKVNWAYYVNIRGDIGCRYLCSDSWLLLNICGWRCTVVVADVWDPSDW